MTTKDVQPDFKDETSMNRKNSGKKRSRSDVSTECQHPPNKRTRYDTTKNITSTTMSISDGNNNDDINTENEYDNNENENNNDKAPNNNNTTSPNILLNKVSKKKNIISIQLQSNDTKSQSEPLPNTHISQNTHSNKTKSVTPNSISKSDITQTKQLEQIDNNNIIDVCKSVNGSLTSNKMKSRSNKSPSNSSNTSHSASDRSRSRSSSSSSNSNSHSPHSHSKSKSHSRSRSHSASVHSHSNSSSRSPSRDHHEKYKDKNRSRKEKDRDRKKGNRSGEKRGIDNNNKQRNSNGNRDRDRDGRHNKRNSSSRRPRQLRTSRHDRNRQSSSHLINKDIIHNHSRMRGHKSHNALIVGGQHMNFPKTNVLPPVLQNRNIHAINNIIGNNMQQQQKFKTTLCSNYMSGECRFGSRCHFAHGSNELRGYGAGSEAEKIWRSKPCKDYIKGTCHWGAKCRFAHGNIIHNNNKSMREHNNNNPMQSNSKISSCSNCLKSLAMVERYKNENKDLRIQNQRYKDELESYKHQSSNSGSSRRKSSK